MLLRRVLLGMCIGICIMLLHSKAYAQSASNQPTSQSVSIPQPINPVTGPSFPCPQPLDPLAQLVCSNPQLALLDMQFVQSFEALLQEVGTTGRSALLQQDIQFNANVRSECNIALSQAASPSPTPPPAAPPGAAQCVIPLYQQQIAVWNARLQGAAAEEANRHIQDQLTLQSRLQALGFLPAKAQIDGVFGTGTRTAIIQWQTSAGRQPTGLLGNADAQALLLDVQPSAPNSSPNPPAQTQSQDATPSAFAQPHSSTEIAWEPYDEYQACMLSKGFQLRIFVLDGILPTDAIAASVLNGCIQAAQQATSAPTSPPAAVPNNSNSAASNTDSSSDSSNITQGSSSGDTSDTSSNSNASNTTTQDNSNSDSSNTTSSSDSTTLPSPPSSAQVTMTWSSFLNIAGDPNQLRTLAQEAGQSIIVTQIDIFTEDTSQYVSGQGGIYINSDGSLGISGIISCHLTTAESENFSNSNGQWAATQTGRPVIEWGTIQSYGEDTGLIIDPCYYVDDNR